MSAKKQKPIPQLFKSRERGFARATRGIFDAMPGALAAIHEFMEVEIIEKIGGRLQWEDVSLVEDGNDPLLIFVGVIVFDPGVELELEGGDKIVITKDTAPYFRRLVRAGLPASVAGGTKESVIAYLEKMEAEDLTQTELQFMDSEVEVETEFDLSKLTEEQRRAYEISTSLKGQGKA